MTASHSDALVLFGVTGDVFIAADGCWHNPRPEKVPG